MSAILSKPQVQFLHAQVLALDAIFKPGEFDAIQALQRSRAIIRVLKLTLETAIKSEDMKGYNLTTFD